ncbi:MAG: GGDEF domain-containing protein [Treponema sp.]|nr:GGDEF domain-containing protein [Treponema sp.]
MDLFFRDIEVQSDSVTGVYDQATISSYTRHLIKEKIPFSFAILDVDNFSYITDAFGKEGGDKVLYDVANTVSSIIGDKGVIGRNQGDEFSIVFKELVSYDEIWNICHSILVKINEIALPEVGNQTLTVTMGIDRFPENASDYDDLLECAEKALYRGKSKGRNCFIIYIPEKHASIVPKTEKQKAFGSLNLHAAVFKFLTANSDLKSGIQNLFNFFSSYFEIDHICVQADKRLLFQKIHQLSKQKDFEYIPHKLIMESMNQQTNVMYVDGTKNLLRAKHIELYTYFEKQNISSTCICDISYKNNFYGTLRVDMTGSESESRRLQYSDTDLFLTAARTIAILLFFSEKKLEDL